MFEETVERRLRPVAAAFAESDLLRIRIADDAIEIELRRSPAGASGPPPAAAPAGEAGAAQVEVVTAEAVGIIRFLRPAVEEGAVVEGDRDLAVVEALGIRNPVRARGPGRIACVYVSDGQVVDYGQPLFALDRI